MVKVPGFQLPGRGTELGDGVRGGSLTRVGTRRIWGFLGPAEPEETGGAAHFGVWYHEVSHRYSQRHHFAQTGEMSFSLLRVFSIVIPFLSVGTLISKNFAALLEEHDISVPEDDDDGD